MTCENEERKPTINYDKPILEIIHKDANESLKIFRDDINSINTRLAVLIGFDTNFAAFLSKIPSQKYFSIESCSLSLDNEHVIPYAYQILGFCTVAINWILSIKPIVGLILIASLISAIKGLFATPNQITLYPKKMLRQAENAEEKSFLKGIINNRDDIIINLESRIQEKALRLNNALLFLGIAAAIVILIIIFDTSVTGWS
jgi:hypothetical protein